MHRQNFGQIQTEMASGLIQDLISFNFRASANMMNYRKGRNVEEELTRSDIKIENLPDDFLWMHVSQSF